MLRDMWRDSVSFKSYFVATGLYMPILSRQICLKVKTLNLTPLKTDTLQLDSKSSVMHKKKNKSTDKKMNNNHTDFLCSFAIM